MTIPAPLVYQGENKEAHFRDTFIMPLLVRLGFGTVVNYHGQREFGRDVIFGDLDRFGHVVYYGMQIKYESSISLSDSNALIQDAEQATHNPFKHPQTGRDGFISCFYIANAGSISDQAREHFFNAVSRKGVRDARLFDGNALLLLDKAASLNRSANIQERLTGMLQEVRRNRNLVANLVTDLQLYASDTEKHPFPMLRCRNTASASYLNAPFSIPDLPINAIDQYWEAVRVFNDIADSVGIPVAGGAFRTQRAAGISSAAAQLNERGTLIEAAVTALLTQLGDARQL